MADETSVAGSATPKCRILIVDDHPLMREGLARLIESEPDIEIWGQAGTAADALLLVEKEAPDLAIVDILLPGATDGIGLTKALLASHPRINVLVLSMYDDRLHMMQAANAGARGYVTKAEVSRKIVDAVRTIRSGRPYLPEGIPVLPPPVPRDPSEPPEVGFEALSRRELELLELLGRGFHRVQIAEKMAISVKTVEAHREHMRRKIGVKKTADLIRYAVKWVERRDRGSDKV